MRLRKRATVAFFLLSFLFAGCATRGHQMTRYLISGNEAALNGDYTIAIQRYEASLAEVPSSFVARRNLGIVLVKVGQYKRAYQMLQGVLPRYAKDVEVRYFLGEAARGLLQFDSALSHYQAALAIDPRDLRVIKAYAWTQCKLGHFDKTLRIVEPLLTAHENDIQLKLIAATAYNKSQRFKETIQTLSVVEKAKFKVQSGDEESAESEKVLLMVALADAYSGLNECEKAGDLYQDVLKSRPFLSNALNGIAKCELNQNQVNRAIQRLERASKADPDAAETYYLLGKALERSDSRKSVAMYRKFLLMARDSGDLKFEREQSKNAIRRLN